MPLEAPYNHNQHRRWSGGSCSFGHNHCVEGAFLRRTSTSRSLLGPQGKIFDGRAAAMKRNHGKSPKLELKLNLLVATTSRRVGGEEESSPNGSSSLSSSLSLSPPSSCVSSGSNSPEATSMVLAGCPRCLMYVMLSRDNPKCPNCNNTVLLDFLRGTTTTTTNTNNTTTTTTTNTNTTTTTTNDEDDNNNSKKTMKS